MQDQGQRLREMLAQPGVLVAPGAYDAMSARLIERAGFPLLYLGSLSIAGAVAGLPDTGLLSPAELIGHMARIAGAVDLPVVADLDDGGGNRIRIKRHIALAEAAGFAAVHIEDTDLSQGKHLPGAREAVIPKARMVDNVRAAVDSRRTGMLVIARTDAMECETEEQVLERMLAYAEAGADMLFIAYMSPDRVRTIRHRLPLPLLGTVRSRPLPSGEAPPVPDEFKVLTYPSGPLFAAIRHVNEFLEVLKRTGRNILAEGENTYETMDRALNTPEWLDFLRGNRSA